MRIAFVGKGGSGKTTLSALFAQLARKKHPVLAIDADLNMHLGSLLGFEEEIPEEKHLSHPEAVRIIKTHLRGKNSRIKELAHFRKTTPPTAESNFIVLRNSKDPILSRFGTGDECLRLMVVGTYDNDDIGASCYHNNLAILENILSHLIDEGGVAVTDMVAGIDAFANTLHMQFDLLILVVEPTRRGIEVFRQYEGLAREAGVYDSLCVVGNKVRSAGDAEFITRRIPSGKFLGFLGESEYLRRKEREGGVLEVNSLEDQNKNLLGVIYNRLITTPHDHGKRLRKLFNLHRRYVAQDFIRERFGDLTNHIDPEFDLESFVKTRNARE